MLVSGNRLPELLQPLALLCLDELVQSGVGCALLGSPSIWLCYVCYRMVASATYLEGSYLVDPASSHMLVSKIKPCMSKYKHLYCETANGSLKQLSSP